MFVGIMLSVILNARVILQGGTEFLYRRLEEIKKQHHFVIRIRVYLACDFG